MESALNILSSPLPGEADPLVQSLVQSLRRRRDAAARCRRSSFFSSMTARRASMMSSADIRLEIGEREVRLVAEGARDVAARLTFAAGGGSGDGLGARLHSPAFRSALRAPAHARARSRSSAPIWFSVRRAWTLRRIVTPRSLVKPAALIGAGAIGEMVGPRVLACLTRVSTPRSFLVSSSRQRIAARPSYGCRPGA